MKKLSELQAWKKIKSILVNKYWKSDCYDLTYGLCGFISDLEDDWLITPGIADRMGLVIDKATPRPRSSRFSIYNRTGFYWGLGRQGLKARINFCDRQIKRLTRNQR